MKIAIPLFDKRVSPRFDVAPKIGLYSIERWEVADYKEILCEDEWDGLDRILKLKELEVDTLICRGLPKHLKNILHNDGIKIIHWGTGSSGEALNRFLKDIKKDIR
jgi:predicted Fe-Mo cluster-binding NifX family protein